MATARSSPTTVEEAVEVLFPGAINPREDTFLLLRLSPEMDRVIEELMEHSALAKEEVINMAVGFLKTVMDAIDEGKRVGIASEDQELEVDFTGI